MYSCDIVDTRSGVKLLTAKPASGTWKTVLGGVGESRLTFAPRDTEDTITRADWKNATRPWDRTLVISFAGVAVHAGLITDEDRAGDVLSVSTAEVRELLSRRYASKPPTYSPWGKLAPSNKSMRGLALSVLLPAFRVVAGDNWTLPFEFPADEAGPHSREWFHHEARTFEDMLSEVESTEGGADVALDPEWKPDGTLHWRARIGNPLLAGATFEWSASVPESPVSDFEEGRDGREQRSGIMLLGKGSGQEMIVGLSPNAGIAGSRIPDMDGTRSDKLVGTKSQADAQALARLRAVREPIEWHSFAVDIAHADHPIDPTHLRLGARSKLWHDGDVMHDPGFRHGYVTSLSGDIATTDWALGVSTL